ncbi:MAG TPA: trypsin-like peptidase domain-containing protein [Phycisphaerae bacterium]|nr:trypsin-like peptidase domain-containing protein [Phycisphaerae bacterium]
MSGWRVLVVMAVCVLGAGRAWGDAPVAYSTEARHDITQLPAAPIVPNGVADLRAIQSRVEAVVKEALPATVAILLDDGQGSGVIVSRDGYVLTAGHVSGKPGQPVTIVLANGKELRGKALGANNNIDSGMVKIIDKPPTKSGFPFVPLGSAKELKAGQWVVALGHPGGYRADRPPVVRLGRVLLATHQLMGTDCPLINGDSGGPVFDLDGRLIGINSRIGATTTTNIHVPIDTFEETWDRLAKGEEWGGATGFLARHGFGGDGESIPADGAALGIRGNDVEGGGPGTIVTRVKSGTAAEKAGLHVGDIVLAIDGRKINGVDALVDKVNEHSPGDVVTLTVLRGGKSLELKATLGAAK